MAINFIRDGKKMQMATVTGAKSGDAFVVGGYLPCVLLTDAGADPYNATVQTEGVFDLSVYAYDGSAPSAVAVGDMLYWTDKDTALNKDSSKDPYGIALEIVGSGETDTINVMLVPKAVMPGTVGTSDLEAAAVETAKIKDKNVTLGKLEDDVSKYISRAITDPGDGEAIPVTASGVCALTTGGAETRTLAIPEFIGQEITLSFDVDVGDCAITAASGINVAGNTVMTMDTAGEYICLVGAQVAGVLAWRVVANDGVALT